ncbi:MAG: hypothetical protein IJV25_07445 [Prevotella sp.]|nr:hypothetical protein [Prevotella sp.]
MEHWIFNKKELHFIANLLVDKLDSLPDNSELSVTDLFTQTFHSAWIKSKDNKGNHISGYKLSDIKMNDGSYLHNHIKWDFDNALWLHDMKQSITLSQLFATKVQRKGFIEDSAIRGGRRMGYPCNLPSIYRKKSNLISSFAGIKEMLIEKGYNQKYYVREIIETKHYHSEDRNGKVVIIDRVKPLQLWRIPKGCTTGKLLVIDDYLRFTVISGMCNISSSLWEYVRLYPQREVSWHEFKKSEDLRINQSSVAKANRYERDVPAPEKAWYQVINQGKSDLFLYVVDTSRFKTNEYEERIEL